MGVSLIYESGAAMDDTPIVHIDSWCLESHRPYIFAYLCRSLQTNNELLQIS